MHDFRNERRSSTSVKERPQPLTAAAIRARLLISHLHSCATPSALPAGHYAASRTYAFSLTTRVTQRDAEIVALGQSRRDHASRLPRALQRNIRFAGRVSAWMARSGPAASALLVAEPGGLQVQAALQPLAGGMADGAVVVEAASSAFSAALRSLRSSRSVGPSAPHRGCRGRPAVRPEPRRDLTAAPVRLAES